MQLHALPRTHETDGPAGRIQVRLEPRIRGHDRQQRRSRVGLAAGHGVDRRHRPVVRRDDDDFSPRFGLGAFLLEFRHAALELGRVASQFQRQVGALGLEVHALARRTEPAALGGGQPGALIEQLGLHLLQAQVGDEALVVQLAVQRDGALRDLDPLARQNDLAFDLLLFGSQGGRALGQGAILLREQALLLDALLCEAGTALGEPLRDLGLRRPELGTLQFVRQRQQAIALVHLVSLVHGQACDDARARSLHANHAFLRQQPAVDACCAGELPQAKQRHDRRRGEHTEEREQAK